MLKQLTILGALIAAPTLALADAHDRDRFGLYVMPFGGLETRPDSDTRGNLATPFGPISGNAVTGFDDAGWLVGGEVGAKIAVMDQISVRVGPYFSYSHSGIAELRGINAAFGAGPSVTFLPQFAVEGDVSTMMAGINVRPAWENGTIVTPHLLLNVHARETSIDIQRFAGVTIDQEKSANWEYGVGGGVGMTIDLTKSMALMVEGAYYRSLEDPRWGIATPLGTATIDAEDNQWTVTTGLVISF